MNNLLFFIEYSGILVFALTGAFIAAKSDYDFFGMLFLAFLTAVGGGTVRDLILDQPVVWTQNPQFLYIIVLAAILSFFTKFIEHRLTKLMFFLDTLGLGLFAIAGTKKSLDLGFNIETSLIMGVISATLGGVLRSVFSNEVPIIFKKEIYATSAAFASVAYYALNSFGFDYEISVGIALLICFAVRYLSVKYNIHFPKAL